MLRAQNFTSQKVDLLLRCADENQQVMICNIQNDFRRAPSVAVYGLIVSH